MRAPHQSETTVARGEKRSRDRRRRAAQQLATLREAGATVPDGAKILELGCGNGDLVLAYLERGFDAYGCDIRFKPGAALEALIQDERVLPIETKPYRLPFEDCSFDLVVSDQVLEHVQDLSSVLRETRRVTKPGGLGLHLFPSRYRPVEPHVRVPGATVIQWRPWLWLWAALGVRKDEQRGLSAREVARSNHSYLIHHTKYLPRARIEEHVLQHFALCRFEEAAFLRHTRRGRYLARVLARVPGCATLYGTLASRVLITER